MTLETAKQIVEERRPNKEAEAIFRGGMYICENTADGGREYVWIKVMPTNTDDESSIDVALVKHRKRETRQTSNTPIGQVQTDSVTPNAPVTQPPPCEIETQITRPSFFGRLKNKAVEIWHEIDSIVVE